MARRAAGIDAIYLGNADGSFTIAYKGSKIAVRTAGAADVATSFWTEGCATRTMRVAVRTSVARCVTARRVADRWSKMSGPCGKGGNRTLCKGARRPARPPSRRVLEPHYRPARLAAPRATEYRSVW